MTRYRRRRLKRGESVATAVSAALIGVGTAAAAYYVTRLFLAREPLTEGQLLRGAATAAGSEAGEPRALTAPRGPEIDGPSSEKAGGHDPGS